MDKQFSLLVNGKEQSVKADQDTPLLYVLRNQLQLNGPKFGCGIGQCGACMVLVDNEMKFSCITPVSTIESKSVKTLEGLADENGALHPVQKAFIEEQAAQCGYCINGLIITAVALLNQHPNPNENQIREKMQPVLCRCRIQPRVIKAIERASKNY